MTKVDHESSPAVKWVHMYGVNDTTDRGIAMGMQKRNDLPSFEIKSSTESFLDARDDVVSSFVVTLTKQVMCYVKRMKRCEGRGHALPTFFPA